MKRSADVDNAEASGSKYRKTNHTTSPSNPAESANFVAQHVRNGGCEITEQRIPALRRRDAWPGFVPLAQRLGVAMNNVATRKLLEVPFQPLVKEALESVLTQYQSRISIGWQVRQGAHTSCPETANFTKCTSSTKCIPDVSIIFKRSDDDETDNEEVVGAICEVKRLSASAVHAINQQLMYTIIQQRSVRRSDDDRSKFLLPGIVVYESCAYITMLETGGWWGHLAELKYVHKYTFKVDAAASVKYSQRSGEELLAVLNCFVETLLRNFDSTHLFGDCLQLPYFAYPAGVQHLNYAHIVRCTWQTVQASVVGTQSVSGRTLWSGATNQIRGTDEVVVKVFCSSVYSNAETSKLGELLRELVIKLQNRPSMFRRLVNYCSSFLPRMLTRGTITESTDPCKWIEPILDLHVWIGRLCQNDEVTAIVTRWRGVRATENPDVIARWPTNGATRRAFFDEVCVPAMKLTDAGFYHGDIRPANLTGRVDDQGLTHFALIDWDDARYVSDDRSVPGDNRYPVLRHIRDKNQRAALFTACQLFICIGIIQLAAEQEDADDIEKRCSSEQSFWTEIHVCPNDRRHRCSKIHKWGRSRGLAAIIAATQPAANATALKCNEFLAILMQALQIT